MPSKVKPPPVYLQRAGGKAEKHVAPPLAANSVLTGSWIYDYASFWARLLAALLDFIALALVLFLFLFFFEPRFFQFPHAYLWGPSSFRFYLEWGIASLLYFTCFEGSTWQATPGKRLLGIRVISEDGKPMTILTAIFRFLGKIPSLAIFGIGFLMILWTPRKQGLHDLLAGSLVVRVLRPFQQELTKNHLQQGAGL